MKAVVDDPDARRVLACVDAAFSRFERHGSIFLIQGPCALLLLRADRPRLTRSIRIWAGIWFPDLDPQKRTEFVPAFWDWHLYHDLSAVHPSTLKKWTTEYGVHVEEPEWLSFDRAPGETERQLEQLLVQAIPIAQRWTSREFLTARLRAFERCASLPRNAGVAEESLFSIFVDTYGVSASSRGWGRRIDNDRFRAFLASYAPATTKG